jgi:cytochrome b
VHQLSQRLPGGDKLSDSPSDARQSWVIWDLPVRLFHWLVVLLFIASWVTHELDLMSWHKLSGYSLLVCVLFRMVWGLIGSTTARFSSFVRGPKAVAAYLTSARAKHARVGHNPLGGWSVVVMLALLLLQCVLGLLTVDEFGVEAGPLASHVTFEVGRQIAGWHKAVFNVLLVVIAMHIAAVIFYLLVRRQNLVGPMISGRRRLSVPPDHELIVQSQARAALVFGVVVLFVYFLVVAL